MPPLPQPFKTAPRRVRRKRRRVASAGPMVNQIVRVSHGGTHGDDAIIVTVNGTVVGIDDYTNVLSIMMDGNAYGPIGGNFDQLPEVLLLFEQDVSASTAWSVPNVGVWHFEDGQPLVEPLSGTIE